jgi:RNA polymerase sigma-70 factor (ECF subfamily)
MSDQPPTLDTCWTLIRGAAAGDARCRDEFARMYLPMVQRCLRGRWRHGRLAQEVDDAAQEVFVECIREQGVIAQAEPGRGGFRGFLFGAVRNVARRFEAREASGKVGASVLEDLGARTEDLADALDREWARGLMREAAERHGRTAWLRGSAARRRVELLRLRFEDGLPIRDIAARWGEDPAGVHEAYRVARREFQDALRKVVAFHLEPESDVDAECRRLLELLGEG